MSNPCVANRERSEVLFHRWCVNRDDAQLLHDLYCGLAARVERLVRQRGLCGADADEVTHEVCVRTLATAGSFSPERGSFSTWLAVIMRSAVCDWQRKNQRHSHTPLNETEPSGGEQPIDKVVREEGIELVREAMTRLSPEQRELLTMRYVEGLTYREISDRLGGLTITSTYRLLRITEQALRSQLPTMEW